MESIIQRFRKSINRWYLLYLVTTELYMVEPWEKVVVHVIFGVIFCMFWYFNYSLICKGLIQLRDTAGYVELL